MLATSAGWIARLLIAVGAAFGFVLGPGLALRRMLRSDHLITSTAFVWIPGTLYLALVGVCVWVLEFAIDPQVVSTVLLLPIPCLLVTSTLGSSRPRLVRGEEWPVLVIVVLLVLIGVGRAAWSQGPVGELYSGAVSRTLEVGDRSDPRIQ